MNFNKIYRLIESKDHLIDKCPDLFVDEKEKVKAFFKSHPTYEKEIDWNKINTLTMKDFVKVMDSAKNSKTALKKGFKKGALALLFQGRKDF